MNQSKKVFLRVLPIVLVLIVVASSSVFGFSNFNTDMTINTAAGNQITSANKAITGVWGTILLILQILAVAAVVIAGIRYMFSNADAKADIKKQTIGLVVGAILVFAASTVIDFIIGITEEVTGQNTNNSASISIVETIENV